MKLNTIQPFLDAGTRFVCWTSCIFQVARLRGSSDCGPSLGDHSKAIPGVFM